MADRHAVLAPTLVLVLCALVVSLGSAAPTCPKGCVCEFNIRTEHPGDCQSRAECPCGTEFPAELNKSLDCVFFWLPHDGPQEKTDWLEAIPSSSRRVDMFGCGIKRIPDGSLSHLKQTRVLNLEYNQLAEIGPKAFDGLINLKVLWLTGHHLRPDDTPAEQYKAMQPLQNRIRTIHKDAFASNSKLVVLLMHHNEIQELPVGLLQAPAQSLRVIKLLDNQMKPLPVAGSGALEGLTAVKQLDIDEDSGDDLEDWMEETGHYLDDDNGDSTRWWEGNWQREESDESDDERDEF